MILAALYLLWAYQRVFHGEPPRRTSQLPRPAPHRGAGDGAAPRPDRVPRRLPEAGARSHRAVGRTLIAHVDARRRLDAHGREFIGPASAEGARTPRRAVDEAARTTTSTVLRQATLTASEGDGDARVAAAGRRPSTRSPTPLGHARRSSGRPSRRPDPHGRRRAAAHGRLAAARPARPAWFYAAWTVATVGAVASPRSVPLWNRVQDDGPVARSWPARSASTASRCSSPSSSASSVILAALLLDGYLRREGLDGPECYVLMLLSASGGVIMAVGQRPHRDVPRPRDPLDRRLRAGRACTPRGLSSQEAGLKYFVLGAFSSAFLLYGIALIYGATGSTNLVEHPGVPGRAPCSRSNGLLLAGLALLLVGFGFKVGRGPVPLLDARRVPGRRRSPVVGLHGLGREGRRLRRAAAGLRRHLRPDLRRRLAADRLRPRRAHPAGRLRARPSCRPNVKRMLAYSSINHAGFILVAVEAASRPGHLGGALLPGRLHLHGGRQLRRRHARRPQRRRPARPRRLQGPGRAPVPARAAVHGLPAGPGRRAVHRRLPGQVLRDRRGRRRGPVRARR